MQYPATALFEEEEGPSEPLSSRSFSALLDELQQTRDSIARSMADAVDGTADRELLFGGNKPASRYIFIDYSRL